MITFCLPASVSIETRCIIAGTLSMLSARGCVPVSSLGSVRGNTVPRDSIDTYTLGSRGGIGYYDPGRSFHSISPPVANGYQEIHRYSGMNIDNVKINTSLIMMKECCVLVSISAVIMKP